MSLKIVDSMWFTTPMHHFGMVITENEMGVKKVRIGMAAGKNQKADERLIADWGARVPKDAGIEFLEQADR